MHDKMNLMSELWSPKTIENLRLRGCGLINCRSRLDERNSVSEEIQQIIDHGSGRNRNR